ncbi:MULTISPECIES: LacI family DNA-binding transcriptional regulator [Halomonadaceae]|uniref:LacI family transcriptional regulator n=1 Tax=Onishia taeanensis TaxID=284577 RepID=A0A328Y6D7_9GAMM|nr:MULTISPECIES: LacI family DNA-binding transcriptional regulator [Halomonas]RAR64335.1 LacI family transcriptional regulator [Halomonas taeanensis]
MARLKDVAKQAGVSITTVSHVVNQSRTVAPATRLRVQRAIAELGYRPDTIARSLQSRRSRTIGMIVTSADNPFFSALIRGVEDHCFDCGYSLMLCNADDVDDKQVAYLHTLLERRIDGLIVMTSRNGPGFLEALNRQTLPTVMLDAATAPRPDIAVVNDDSRLGARLAIEHLLAQGLDDIALLTGPTDHPRSQERLAGALDACQTVGLTLPSRHIITTNLLADGGYAAMRELLEKDHRPQAVFAFNDLAAIGAIRAALEAGLSVPDKMSVIGYDDIDVGRYTCPALTTIHQPIYELGATAIAQLIDRLEHQRPFAPLTALPPRLVVRESVRQRER